MAVTLSPAEDFEATGEEETRGKIAFMLIKLTGGIVSLTLVGVFFLIYVGKLEVDKAITLFLAVSTIFSGLLGSAITYYFSSKGG